MADYAGPISLSHPHTSDDDSSDHSPRSLPTLSCTAVCLTGGSSSKPKKLIPTAADFGSSPDTAKKPRGRPPGSKNKPKPPLVITKDSDSAMKPVVIEISAGSDVVETLIQYARRRHVGLSILSGSGSVSNVTLRHPMSHATSLSLHGPFSLVSLSGTFLPSATPAPSSSSKPTSFSFGICLAGAQGQVFGGIVGGKVIAASLVVVVAATFLNPAFHLLPNDPADDAAEETKPTVHINEESGGGGGSASPMSVCGYSGGGGPAPINCQTAASEAMAWGPNSRSSY